MYCNAVAAAGHSGIQPRSLARSRAASQPASQPSTSAHAARRKDGLARESTTGRVCAVFFFPYDGSVPFCDYVCVEESVEKRSLFLKRGEKILE